MSHFGAILNSSENRYNFWITLWSKQNFAVQRRI